MTWLRASAPRAARITGAGRLHGIAAGIAPRLADDGWNLGLSFWRRYDAQTSTRSRDDEPERLADDLRGPFCSPRKGAWTTGELIHRDGGLSA